jgi:hypothetical protein
MDLWDQHDEEELTRFKRLRTGGWGAILRFYEYGHEPAGSIK